MKRSIKTGETDFHGFPRIVDNYAHLGKFESIIGRDGRTRTKITLKGGYKNREGHFEWIIEPNKAINHRIFIPKEW